MPPLLRTLVAGLALTGLAACDDEEQAATPEPVRAIKYVTLSERAGEQERRISGVVKAAITTNVAFEIGGQVVELLRNPGDPVEAGDLIARLDAEPYRLQVSQAENSLAQALAQADDSRKKFEQQRQLREQGFATQTAFDSAEATMKNADGAVGVARSQLELAERDLNKTDLRAPFGGVVARKEVEVFEEITGGTPVYAIQTQGETKVEAALPETLVNVVSLGSPVNVLFPPLGDATASGTVDEITPLAGDANSYPIKVRLAEAPPGLRSGMSAELIFRFATEQTGEAFMVPLAAIRPSVDDSTDGTLFVFDVETSQLEERAVRVVNIRDNLLEIVGPIETGEIIAAAGVSFLHDGLEVTLFDPAALE